MPRRNAIRLKSQPLESRIAPAIFTVTNTDDAGAGSLRQAVLDANAAADFDQIRFDAGVFSSAQTINLTTGEIAIRDGVDIVGPGANLLTLDAKENSRIFRIGGPGYFVAYISKMSFASGNTADNGGAITLASSTFGETDEFVSISECNFSGNKASKDGGSVYLEAGSMTLTNCSFTNNMANRGGGLGAGSVSTTTVQLIGCSFQNNSATTSGGAIVNQGSAVFELTNCQFNANTAVNSGGAINGQGSVITITGGNFTNNTATNSSGGGIATQSTLNLTNVAFAGNSATGGGGLSMQGKLVAVGCSFTNNVGTSTVQSGGGLSVQGDCFLINTTVHGNTAGSGGGVAINLGAKNVRVTNSTITGNTATFGLASGGGISFASGSTVYINNTVVAGNGFTVPGNKGPDVFGTIFSGKNNLVGDGGGQTGLVNGVDGNIVGTNASPADPQLGALQNNGGNTLSRVPAPNSPLINAGNTSLTFDPLFLPLDTDQRGIGFPRVLGSSVDIGAIESATAPRVGGFQVNDGSVQRSRVGSVSVTFTQSVTLPANPADAFELRRQSDNAIVTLNALVMGNTVQLACVGGPMEFGSLADGRYTLTVLASKVDGGALDGNGDGVSGDNYVLTGSPTNGLFRLFGDADGNGTVNTVDFNAFRTAFGGSSSIFDFDNAGGVGTADFNQFRARFGSSV